MNDCLDYMMVIEVYFILFIKSLTSPKLQFSTYKNSKIQLYASVE